MVVQGTSGRSCCTGWPGSTDNTRPVPGFASLDDVLAEYSGPFCFFFFCWLQGFSRVSICFYLYVCLEVLDEG